MDKQHHGKIIVSIFVYNWSTSINFLENRYLFCLMIYPETYTWFILFRWRLPLEPVRINVCYFKTNKDHFPHNFIFASDDESMDIWGLSEYEYPGMVKVTYKNTYL